MKIISAFRQNYFYFQDTAEGPGYPNNPDVKCLGVNVETAKDCQLKCLEDPDCKYWSWNKNKEKQHCIGKTFQGVKEISASFVSGPKHCGKQAKINK